MSEQRGVVVLKPCCIGDAVMALPALQLLRASHPDARIAVWSGHHSRAIFAQHPAIDAVEPMPDIPGLLDLPRLAARLRASRAGTLIILDRSRLLEQAAHLSGIPDVRLVQRGPAGPRHESDCYLEALGVPIDADSPPLPRIELNPAHEQLGVEVARRHGHRFVVLHPGGAENPGVRMHSKRWPLEHWVEVADWLAARNISVVLTGSEDERSLCLELAARSELGLGGATILAGDVDILESTAVIARAQAYVGPDTGLSHLAAATGTPTFVIFGPTNPARYGPRGECVTILAPDTSWRIADTDLRHAQPRVELPTTSLVTPDMVTEALVSSGIAGENEAGS